MLCSIGCLFQFVHDFFNLDKFDTIFFFFKEFGDKKLVYVICLIFYIGPDSFLILEPRIKRYAAIRKLTLLLESAGYPVYEVGRS
mgnify:FL=1